DGLGHFVGGETRNHLVGHGDGVNGGSDFDRAFADVFFVDALVGIEIGVVGVRAGVEGILGQSDPGQGGRIERSAVRTTGGAAVAGGSTHEAPVSERRHGFANHVGGFGRTEDSRAARLTGAGIDVEVSIEIRLVVGRFNANLVVPTVQA